MKIAVDNQISKLNVKQLINRGLEIVYRADDQFDNIWFNEALNFGAEIFVSPDFDIDQLCEKYKVLYIRLPQNISGLCLNDFIEMEVKKLNE
jgi:hypothetical protein